MIKDNSSHPYNEKKHLAETSRATRWQPGRCSVFSIVTASNEQGLEETSTAQVPEEVH